MIGKKTKSEKIVFQKYIRVSSLTPENFLAVLVFLPLELLLTVKKCNGSSFHYEKCERSLSI